MTGNYLNTATLDLLTKQVKFSKDKFQEHAKMAAVEESQNNNNVVYSRLAEARLHKYSV